MTVIFDNCLLFIMESGAVYYLNLAKRVTTTQKAKFKVNEELQYLYKECVLTTQGIRCLSHDNFFHFFSFSFKIKEIVFQPLAMMENKNIVNNNIMNNMFRSATIITLKKSIFFGGYTLSFYYMNELLFQQSDLQDFVSNETKLYQVSISCFLLFTFTSTMKKLVTVHFGSILHFPLDRLMMSELITFNFPIYDNIFFMVYRTDYKTIRCAIFQTILDVRKRLLQDFEVDNEDCQKPLITSNYGPKATYYTFYRCGDAGRENVFFMWDMNPDGPFLNPTRDSTKQTISIEGKPHVINLKMEELDIPFNAETTNFMLRDPPGKDGIVIYNLETTKTLDISGNILHVELLSNNPHVKFTNRLNHVYSEDLIKNKKFLRKDLTAQIIFRQSKPLINFGDYYYYDKKLEFNNDYFQCQKCEMSYVEDASSDSSQDLLLCRGKVDFQFYLTDLDKLSIPIETKFLDSNVNVNNPYIIRIKNHLYLFLRYSANKSVRIIRIFRDNHGKYTVERSQAFVLEMFINSLENARKHIRLPHARFAVHPHHLSFEQLALFVLPSFQHREVHLHHFL